MQKIIPYLWFNNQASEAISFYTHIFNNSYSNGRIELKNTGPDQNETVSIGTFRLANLEFLSLNGGPMFTFSPANSFFVTCETEHEIDAIWEKLSEGGAVFMPLNLYPFSKKFGWVQDKYGLSWQLNFTGDPLKIMPFLTFVQDQNGKAEEAMKLYTSLFPNSEIKRIAHYGLGQQGTEGTVMHGSFSIDGVNFMAMDSNGSHQFKFTEAVSYFVHCETQQEVDFYWDKLIENGGKESRCGWLKDKFGISWQIIPGTLMRLMRDPDQEKAQRVMQAMLKMNKIDIKTLEEAYVG